MKILKMTKYPAIFCCLIMIANYSYSQVKPTLDLSPRTALANDNKEENGNGNQDIFDLLISEAKTFYVDALISAYFKDTSEAKYCFDRVFEIIAEISDLDTLTLLQQDDFNRFYEKVSSDFQQNYAYLNSDSGTYGAELLREEIFETVIDSVEIGNDTLIVLDDRPGHIPLVRSRKIDRITDFICGRESWRFQQYLDNSGYYRDHIMPILAQYGLPEELFYLPLIESGFNPNAYSYAHAAGMWQFIAGTGARYGLKRNWWIDERRDPIKSTHAAAKYLKKLYEEFNDWFLALAAYNAGELRIWRAIKREGTRDYWKLKSLPQQTRDYVPTFMASMLVAKNPEKYGFTNSPKDKWEWDEVPVSSSYEFDAIARACGVSVEEIRRLNPELRRWVTPPNEPNYILRVPVGKGDSLIAKLKQLPPAIAEKRTEWLTHKVKKGQTLHSISNKYGVTISAIVAANHIKRPSQLRVGQMLVIPTDRYYAAPRTSSEDVVFTHTVQKGESLSLIAKKYNTSVTKIRSLNNLQDDIIQPGTILKVRGTKAAIEATASTSNETKKIIHIVAKGETLGEIAAKYNVSVSNIRAWNNLEGHIIYPKQKIIIYRPESS